MIGPESLHATCVAMDGRGILLIGASGSGKSDLALRLIDRGAKLVSDDRVTVQRDGDRLVASTPGPMFGQIEIRAVGICRVEAVREVEVALVVRLGVEGDRLPEAPTETVGGIALPLLRLDAHRASAPIKVEMALKQGVGIA